MTAIHHPVAPLSLLVGVLSFVVMAGGIFIILRLFFGIVSGLMRGAGRTFASDSVPAVRQAGEVPLRGAGPQLCQNARCRRANIAAARFCANCGTRLP